MFIILEMNEDLTVFFHELLQQTLLQCCVSFWQAADHFGLYKVKGDLKHIASWFSRCLLS